MPITFDIDASKRLVTVRVTGTLHRDEVASARRAVTSSPDFRADFGQIMDLTAVEQVNMDPAELRELAKSPPFAPGSRRAMVAPTDLLYGLGRLFEMSGSSEGWRMRVFHTLAEAQAWLEKGEEE